MTHRFPFWQIDAFTDRPFRGNPAAVVDLGNEWLPDETLQAIAAEMNLSETAFLLSGRDPVALRWFTPRIEVPLCGHATLAAAHALVTGRLAGHRKVRFETASGCLPVSVSDAGYTLDFPMREMTPCDLAPAGFLPALGVEPTEVFQSVDRYVCVLPDAQSIETLEPSQSEIARLPLAGLIVTAAEPPGGFVSRYFAPKKGIPEDPVTGTSHCTLMPFWSARLDRKDLVGRQASPRGGTIFCHLADGRVSLTGSAMTILTGEIGWG